MHQAHDRGRSIASLTGIRGVAAVWVMMTHFQSVMAHYLGAPGIIDNSFLYNGFRGVDLFFVLSGFILMHVHADDFRTFEPDLLRRFYILRFFRVYPLNTVILLALVPMALLLPDLVAWFRFDHGIPIAYHSHDFSAAGFVQSLLLAQTWTVVKLGEWNGPAWSLSAEVFGYTMFPALAYAIVRRTSAIVCVGGAIASLGVLMGLLVAFHHTQDSPTGTFGLIRMIFGFVAGMFLARCFQLAPDAHRLGSGLTIASLAFIVATLSLGSAAMFIVFGFAALILGLAYQRGPVDALLSSRPAMFLGRISFSLYMIHYVPLKVALWLLQDTALGASSLAVRTACLCGVLLLCFGLAIIVHDQLELRFQRLARKVLRRRSGTPVPALAT